MQPTISVIAPVYKVEKYLDRSVQSMLNQSFSDYELILIDDGSPDRSGEMCDAYARADNRIRVIHKPNGGVGSARNAGLDVARGRFIVFLDPDDYVEKDYLKNLLEAQQKHDADMVVSRFYLVKDYDPGFCQCSGEPGAEEFVPRAEFGRVLPHLWSSKRLGVLYSKIYKSELLSGLRYDTQIKLAGDTMLICDILGRAQSMELSNICDYRYVIYKTGSITKQVDANLFDTYLRINAKIERDMAAGGWLNDEMRAVIDERIAQSAAKSIQSIRRGKWSFFQKARYVRAVLERGEFRQSYARCADRIPGRMYKLMGGGHAAALLVYLKYVDARKDMTRRKSRKD